MIQIGVVVIRNDWQRNIHVLRAKKVLESDIVPRNEALKHINARKIGWMSHSQRIIVVYVNFNRDTIWKFIGTTNTKTSLNQALIHIHAVLPQTHNQRELENDLIHYENVFLQESIFQSVYFSLQYDAVISSKFLMFEVRSESYDTRLKTAKIIGYRSSIFSNSHNFEKAHMFFHKQLLSNIAMKKTSHCIYIIMEIPCTFRFQAFESRAEFYTIILSTKICYDLYLISYCNHLIKIENKTANILHPREEIASRPLFLVICVSTQLFRNYITNYCKFKTSNRFIHPPHVYIFVKVKLLITLFLRIRFSLSADSDEALFLKEIENTYHISRFRKHKFLHARYLNKISHHQKKTLFDHQKWFLGLKGGSQDNSSPETSEKQNSTKKKQARKQTEQTSRSCKINSSKKDGFHQDQYIFDSFEGQTNDVIFNRNNKHLENSNIKHLLGAKKAHIGKFNEKDIKRLRSKTTWNKKNNTKTDVEGSETADITVSFASSSQDRLHKKMKEHSKYAAYYRNLPFGLYKKSYSDEIENYNGLGKQLFLDRSKSHMEYLGDYTLPNTSLNTKISLCTNNDEQSIFQGFISKFGEELRVRNYTNKNYVQFKAESSAENRKNHFSHANVFVRNSLCQTAALDEDPFMSREKSKSTNLVEAVDSENLLCKNYIFDIKNSEAFAQLKYLFRNIYLNVLSHSTQTSKNSDSPAQAILQFWCCFLEESMKNSAKTLPKAGCEVQESNSVSKETCGYKRFSSLEKNQSDFQKIKTAENSSKYTCSYEQNDINSNFEIVLLYIKYLYNNRGYLRTIREALLFLQLDKLARYSQKEYKRSGNPPLSNLLERIFGVNKSEIAIDFNTYSTLVVSQGIDEYIASLYEFKEIKLTLKSFFTMMESFGYQALKDFLCYKTSKQNLSLNKLFQRSKMIYKVKLLEVLRFMTRKKIRNLKSADDFISHRNEALLGCKKIQGTYFEEKIIRSQSQPALYYGNIQKYIVHEADHESLFMSKQSFTHIIALEKAFSILDYKSLENRLAESSAEYSNHENEVGLYVLSDKETQKMKILRCERDQQDSESSLVAAKKQFIPKYQSAIKIHQTRPPTNTPFSINSSFFNSKIQDKAIDGSNELLKANSIIRSHISDAFLHDTNFEKEGASMDVNKETKYRDACQKSRTDNRTKFSNKYDTFVYSSKLKRNNYNAHNPKYIAYVSEKRASPNKFKIIHESGSTIFRGQYSNHRNIKPNTFKKYEPEKYEYSDSYYVRNFAKKYFEGENNEFKAENPVLTDDSSAIVTEWNNLEWMALVALLKFNQDTTLLTAQHKDSYEAHSETENYTESLQDTKSRYKEILKTLSAIYDSILSQNKYMIDVQQHDAVKKLISRIRLLSEQVDIIFYSNHDHEKFNSKTSTLEKIRRKAIGLGFKALMQMNPYCSIKSQKIVTFESLKYLLHLSIENEYLKKELDEWI